MPDVFTRAKRSAVMSRIRSRGNQDTELALARLLHTNGIRGWRRHVVVSATVESRWLRVDGSKTGKRAGRKSHHPSTRHHQLTVRPDFVFREVRLALFVDGCFWHGCPKHCKYAKELVHAKARAPLSRKQKLNRTGRLFWIHKLAANRARDRLVKRTLRQAGWKVVRVWEHELQKCGVRNAERGTDRLVEKLRQALRQPNGRGRPRRDGLRISRGQRTRTKRSVSTQTVSS